MGLWNDIAGVADHAAGSVDESIGRQFDNESGGGFADYDTYAGWADHMAGSVDESIGRQFDDEPGGGVADEAANTVWATVAGQGDWWAGEYDEAAGQATQSVTQSLGAIKPLVIGGAGLAVGLAALEGMSRD